MTDMTDQAIDWVQRTVAHARQAVLRVLRPGRDARAAPRAEGVDRQVQGQVRRTAGTSCAKRRWPARTSSASCRPSTPLAPKPEAIKDWDELTADEKRLFARQMEVFAGFGEYADHEIGRLVKTIEEMGQLDNTLFLYIVGDNGASAEGGMNGMFNEMTYFNGVPETVADQLKRIDELGGPKSYRPLRGRVGGGRRYAVHLDQAGRRAASAAPATRWSSPGRRESRPRAKSARSCITSSTSRRRCWRSPVCRSRRSSTVRRRRRSRA